jgi:hypothetical protein
VVAANLDRPNSVDYVELLLFRHASIVARATPTSNAPDESRASDETAT